MLKFVSAGDTNYNIPEPVKDRNTSYNDYSIPGIKMNVSDLKRFSRTTACVDTAVYKSWCSLRSSRTFNKFQGRLVKSENLNLSF